MFKFGLIAVSSVLLAGALAGCMVTIPGSMPAASGRAVTQEYDLSGFSRVETSGAFEVTLTASEDYQVSVSVDEAFQPYLDVAVRGDTLVIGFKPGARPNILGASTRSRAEVAMPELAGLQVSGASVATLSGFESDRAANLEASGASSIKGDLKAGDVSIEVSGASRATLAGSGRQLKLEASGASTADLDQFVVEDADVNVSGASSAMVNASGIINIDASGASRVQYAGDARLGSVDSSGASTIRQK